MASASHAPATPHALDMIPVCPTCLEAYKKKKNRTKQLRNCGCLVPQLHSDDHSDWPLTVMHEKSGHLEAVRPVPAVRVSGNFIMCWNIKSYKRRYMCRKNGCTYAHTHLEQKAWNRAKKIQAGPKRSSLVKKNDSSHVQAIDTAAEPLPRDPPDRSTTMFHHQHNYSLPPLPSLRSDLLEVPLTYDNYQDKFHMLLYYEEHEHEEVLRKKCDGIYNVTTYSHSDGTIHGTITNMTSTQVAYVKQAAVGLKLIMHSPTVSGPLLAPPIEAEFPKPSPHAPFVEYDDDKVYFVITNQSLQIIRSCYQFLLQNTMSYMYHVQFILKHHYFASLHKSLENLKPHVIAKLIPRPDDLHLSLRNIKSLPKAKTEILDLDSEYQFIALKKMMGCSSNAIFLVTGPFGTGKTRLLATAAYNFLKIPNSRVLICTCHTQSADTYINEYFGPMIDKGILNQNILLRLVAKSTLRNTVKPSYSHYVSNSLSQNTGALKQKTLVVTTLINTQQLWQLRAPPYTHILIDEGTQAREPETVAPLALADKHTKIVIAGDHLQIGPQVLVLGEKPKKCGLATSLLQRVHTHYEENTQSTKHLSSILLTNYRCHETILRLPSALFFESTLQARSTSELHPSGISALEFVCTSLDQSRLHNCPDFNEVEVEILLEQVKHYVNNWPVAEWKSVQYSKICVMSPSATQISKIRHRLKTPKFSSLQGIVTLKSYELQGREFRAVFISALEATEANGATVNPTKSICDPYVFNTIITRAQSLVVCVGNPFLLLSIESHHTEKKQCWREYLKRCLEVSSLKIAPQCRKTAADATLKIHDLYLKVFGDLQSFLTSPRDKVDDTVADSILIAYKRAFQSLPDCRKLKVTLGRITNGDRGYIVKEDKGNDTSEEEEEEETVDPGAVECYLQCDSYRLSWGIPINPKLDPIKIQGIDNRRRAFDGARVQVSLYKDIERSGYVTKIIEQGPQWQYICTVDEHNSIIFSPIDRKNPRFVNLPGLSRNLLLKEGNEKTIRKELEVKQHSVAVFDPASFSNPNENNNEENDDIEIPQIKDVIPLNIARQLLFVVWFLSWEKGRRYPLGVVVAALPKGLTFFHAERMLCIQHNISAPNIRITSKIEAQLSTAPSAVNTGNVYNNAIIIEQPDVAFTIEFSKECKDGATLFVLGVHVVNVARFLEIDTPMDQLACHRGTSLRNFGPGDKQHPMLPPSAIKKWSFCCSKLLSAISASCKICFQNGKPALHPESSTINESCVCPNITLSFREVQQILETQFSEGHEVFKGDTKESKIGLLYSIAKCLCCKRLQSSIPVLGTSESKEFPHAHFLVNELMVWMNRTVAEYMLSKPSSFPSILHKQRKPNISQFANIVKKHVDTLPFHPLLKILPQSPRHIAKPFILEQSCFVKLQEALRDKRCIKASEILSVFQNQPQIAVTCKELSLTEPDHEYICSSLLQKMSRLKLDLNSYMLPAEDDTISPYAHHGLHCLSSVVTSPLQSYLDIVAQRLLLNALNDKVLYSYSQEKLTSLCKTCQIKQDSAAHCEQSISQLNLTLSLAECAQPFMVFVGTVKDDSPGDSTAQGDKNTIRKGRLQLVFPDPALHWLDQDQSSVTISSIMCGNSKVHFQNGRYKSTWSAKVTSFLHSFSTDLYHDGSCCISKDDMAANDDGTNKMIFMVPSGKGDAKNSPLVKEPFAVQPNNPVVSIPPKDWNNVEQFIKSPCEGTSVSLLKVLDKLPTVAMPKATLLKNSNEFKAAFESSSMWLYSGQLSIEPYKVLKVWLSASYAKPLLSPTIQLLEVAPFLNICVQHNRAPASCFASPILSNASKVKYNSIEEYVNLWEDVLLADASVQTIKEAEMKIIHDVELKWPRIKQPESSLDDVYFVPDGNIILCPTGEFLEMSKDFFSFDVGDLVCVRYKVPMTSKSFTDHCTNYGLKDDKGYVVFHLVVYEIGRDVTGVINDVFLKFASPQTTRISAFMKNYLMAKQRCELQLIPLNVSHRRVYKSLRSLLSPSHTVNKKLVFDIALGNITAQGASKVDHTQVLRFKPQQIEPVLKLWPLSDVVCRSLNDSQLYSIMLAMKNKLQLVQGPPGTGKSVTGAHLAYGFVHKNRSKSLTTADGRVKCVLVCGPSNKSVDVVLDLLLQLGDPNLRLLRIYGSSIEGKDHVGPYHNKEVFIDVGTDQVCRRDHQPYALHWLVRSAACQYHKRIKDMDREFERLAKEKKVPSAGSREKYRKTMRQAEDEIFQHGYDIVLCTCNEASSSRVIRNIAPVQVIIDEAAMATEPESMVPIKLASERVTLIGDHMQLQPVIDYQQAAEFGLGTSLFERYAAPSQQKAKQSAQTRRSAPTVERHFFRLNVQYRMHWKICEFPSKMFYDGELQTDPNATADFVQIKKFWPMGRDCPLAFCNIDGREGGAVSGNKKSSLLSKSNADEARKVAEIIEVLHKVKRIPQAQIAVLTPYTSQKDVIRTTLQKKKLTGIAVQTVTESQGREFGFVILSTVRSQPRRTISNRRAVQPDRKWLLDHLGFVTDKHQICVGITRAKHGLIIVGNKTLLDYDDTWHKLIVHYSDKGYVKSAKEFPSAEDLQQLRVQ